MRTVTPLLCAALLSACAQTPDLAVNRDRSNDLGDDDRDGVINHRDDCPNTPAGLVLNDRGCPVLGDDGKPKQAWTIYRERP